MPIEITSFIGVPAWLLEVIIPISFGNNWMYAFFLHSLQSLCAVIPAAAIRMTEDVS